MVSQTPQKKQIAVIGSGIAGLSAAWLLSKHHDVTVFEAGDYFGGHANTVTVPEQENVVDVDTGFIVCNDRNYPTFLALMDHLSVEYVPTDMSFGVSIGQGNFEYAGADSLGPLLGQKSNIIRPRFWSMVRSLLRFYRETNKLSVEEQDHTTLGEYLVENGYSQSFIRDHILPMAAAVWSTPSRKVADFPLKSFLRFCQNHGLLQVNDRPQWYTINGGSQNYVKRLVSETNATFKRNCAVTAITRDMGQVRVQTVDGQKHQFDRILMATHADISLDLLKDADSVEQEILSGFRYAKNHAVLHSDESFMPKRKAVWSSWNYSQDDVDDLDHLSVTYWMNKLQPLATEQSYLVTLNPARPVDEKLVHYRKTYDHPIFDLETLQAQKEIITLMGHRQVWYAGAHLGYGFHEDGIQSGLYAAELLGGHRRPDYIPNARDRVIGLEDADSRPFSLRQAAE